MQCWQVPGSSRQAGVKLAFLIATGWAALGLASSAHAETAAARGVIAPVGPAAKRVALDQRPVAPIPDGLPAGAPPAVPAEGLKPQNRFVRGSPLPAKKPATQVAALTPEAEPRPAKPVTVAAVTGARKAGHAAAANTAARTDKPAAEPVAKAADAMVATDAARAADADSLKGIADRVKQQLAIGASKTARELLGDGWTELMLQRNDMAWSFCESVLIVCDRAAFGMKAVPYQRMWIRADQGYDVSRAIEIGDLEAVGLQTSGFADWVRIQPNAVLTRLPDTDQGVPTILVTEAL